MKKIINNLLCITAVICCVSITACNEKLHYNETEILAPVIESFSPASGPVGTVVTIKGEYLNTASRVTLGGVEVPIHEKISNTTFSIKTTIDAKNGKIEITNSAGTTVSADEFTFEYVMPSIDPDAIADIAEMGAEYSILGDYMMVVDKVIFTAKNADAEGRAANIVNRTNRELVVRVPYVATNEAYITLTYNNGTDIVETPLAAAPVVSILKYVPKVTTMVFPQTNIGSLLYIDGENLDKIDSIKIGGFISNINRTSPERISVSIPAGDFPDGLYTTDMVMYYFDGEESEVLTDNLQIFNPLVKFWEGITVYGQAKTVEICASFFSPETGIRYTNDRWRTDVDPVSYNNGGTSQSAANVPAVSEAEYNSVNPYFFFSGVNVGNLQINGPGNSNGQLKNFWIGNVSGDDNRVPGGNINAFGTPVMMFRYLDPGSTSTFERELIEKVRNRTLDDINEQLFPADAEANTIAGIGVNSASGGLAQTTWAVGKLETGKAAENVNVDAVIMVIYYNHNGSVPGKAANIKRIGFMHIENINYRFSGTAPSESEITFSMYWQKYDYDYSKL